ncbi:MAG: glycosyltransferase family 39 protein, partial [Acidobacteriota bacterium]
MRPVPRPLLVILVLGAAARIWGFATAGPLWLDELFLDHNLERLSFVELAGPLLDGQNAPVAWLWLEKALWLGFGASEFGLRLPALIASLASLPLIAAVAGRALPTSFALFPVMLVTFSPFAIWQSFQLKPYAVDLGTALLLLWLGQRWVDSESDDGEGRRPWTLALVGGASVWLSLPAIFVLAGVGAVLALDAWRRPAQGRRFSTAAVGALWLLSFGAHYFLFLRPRPQPEWLYGFWSSGLMAWPPDRWDVFWLPRVLIQSLADPAGFAALAPVAAVLVVAGFATAA